MIDLVGGPLVVNATNADNAINYIQGPNSNTPAVGNATSGLVSIDNQESIEFANKTTLVINALAGSDTTNLNNPTTPTGLTDIFVNASDPTASDSLVVNGRGGFSETMRLAPAATGAGTITNFLAVPPIHFTGIEHLDVVQQLSDLDAFAVDGTPGDDLFRVESGPAIGQLHVEGTMSIGGAAFQLPSIDISGQNSLGNAPFNSIVGGGDAFEVIGTESDDRFLLNSGGGVGLVLHSVNGIDVNFIPFANIVLASLEGRNGDDRFDVLGDSPDDLPFSVNLYGGNPSHSDSANFSFPSGPVTVNLADPVLATDTTVTGYGTGTVTLSGVELANLDTNTLALTVIGTSTEDVITYTPTGASAGSFELAGLNTVFNFAQVVDPFIITGGGAGFADTVIVQGTNARDTFQMDQGARTVQVLANGAIGLKLVNLANSVETLTAMGLAGQDTFRVIPAPGIGGFPLDNLLVNVDGGADGENNALVVENSFAGGTLPATTFVVVHRGSAANSGTVRVFENAAANPDIHYQNVQVVSPNVALVGPNPNLLVMGPDENEPNNFQANATFLGGGATIEVANAAIFPNSTEFPGAPADVDFYRILAEVTGILDLRILFRTVAAGLLPGNGELVLEILDSLGNTVGTVGAINGGLAAVIPVVAGESYYARVAGNGASVVNGYSLYADNVAAPVPTAVVLDPLDDTGSSNLDRVTFEVTDVHFFIHADLAALADSGITILTPAQANAGDTPGAAVEVFVNGVSVGFASVIAGTDNTLFEIELNADLVDFPAGVLAEMGVSNLITSAVRIFDVQEDGGGAPDPNTARSLQSPPLQVLFDDAAPQVPVDFALLETSDSGTPGDGITSVNPPAFTGRGEANTIVRVYADGFLVGEGVVGSDATDGVLGDGLGRWEVTVEPLTDGSYSFSADLEDLAGNIGDPVVGLVVEIDTTPPQRPTIDLSNNYDTGSFNLDNVTYFTTLEFLVSAEAGSEVVIKDGNTVIHTIPSFPAPPDGYEPVTLDFVALEVMFGIPAIGPHALSVEATDDAGNISHQSEELLLEIDPVPPAPPSTPELLDASDSGTIGDGITSVNPPAFKGTGEANAIVRIFATLVGVDDPETELVGIGRVGSDLTEPPEDLPNDPPIGAWEVTIEPLADGMYIITAELEDLAGNISDMSGEFELEIDTLAPQRPTIDLVNAYDTGMSDLDNVTYLSTLQFLVSAEPGTDVVIKDGNTIVDSFVMPAVPFTPRTLDFIFLEGINGIPAEGPHPLSAEATDEADNRSHQSEELLVEIDLTNPDPASVPDLLASSDSGKFDDDNVTNVQALAFVGTGEANAKVRIFANGLLVGQGVVGSDLTEPPPELPETPPAFGEWEITTEPLDTGSYLITVEIEDLSGRITVQEESLEVWVDTVLPNTPYLDLTDVSDTGRHNQDNVTMDNTPTVTSTIDDVQGAGNNNFPNEVIYRIYDRPGTGPDVLLVDSFTTIGFSNLKFFTDVLPVLADGVHNLKLEAEDLAGNINDFLLEITIDTQAPPVFFGLSGVADDGLDPDSDSGVNGVPGTFVDRITNVTRPTFWGSAEANTLVRLFNTDLGPSPIFGEDQAIPIDGNFAFPNGRWSISTTIDLNDPAYFSLDGLREMAVIGEDLAGNKSELELLDIFIDTRGPQISNVSITNEPGYNLFGLKPGNGSQGPTPLVFSLTIDLWDLPRQDALFLRDAIEAGVAETPGLITLVGDHNGIISIDDIIVTNDTPVAGQVATASIELVFNTPLPDDRFTLTVHDDIVDIAGNNLDGENNAIEPNGAPDFPSGDGQPGGDFVARFTVDSRAEIGSYAATSIYIDINGNLYYDPQGANNDETNRDLTFNLGIVPSLEGVVSPFNVHDGLFAGNFPNEHLDNGENGEVAPANAGLYADGYDKLAAYGYDNLIGRFRWLIDTNHDGIIDPAAGDHATIQPNGFQINGLPVAGNFDGNADNGDEIGLFDGTQWYFDTNHDYIIDGSDPVFSTNLRGSPIVGDFNGDGIEDLGTWRNDQFTFDFGSGSPPSWNGAVEAVINWGLPGTADKPVAADMDADGITDIGLWLPERSGTLPLEGARWEWLISNDYNEQHRGGHQVDALNHPFSPTPLGTDIFSQFGDAFGLPIVGNFDPPVASPQLPTPESLGAVLGELTTGSHTINGEAWYSFTPLRDGTIMVEATTDSPETSVSAKLYDSNYNAMGSSAAAGIAQVAVSSSVSAGETYMLRLAGENATADVGISNQVAEQDRLDTSRDGQISPFDLLKVFNELIQFGSHETPMATGDPKMFLDTNLDGFISPADALQVINFLILGTAQPATAQSPSDDGAVAPMAAPAAAGEAPTADSAVAFGLSLASANDPATFVGPMVADAVYSDFGTGTSASLLESPDVLPPVDDEPLEPDPLDEDAATARLEMDLDWLG